MDDLLLRRARRDGDRRHRGLTELADDHGVQGLHSVVVRGLEIPIGRTVADHYEVADLGHVADGRQDTSVVDHLGVEIVPVEVEDVLVSNEEVRLGETGFQIGPDLLVKDGAHVRAGAVDRNTVDEPADDAEAQFPELVAAKRRRLNAVVLNPHKTCKRVGVGGGRRSAAVLVLQVLAEPRDDRGERPAAVGGRVELVGIALRPLTVFLLGFGLLPAFRRTGQQDARRNRAQVGQLEFCGRSAPRDVHVADNAVGLARLPRAAAVDVGPGDEGVFPFANIALVGIAQVEIGLRALLDQLRRPGKFRVGHRHVDEVVKRGRHGLRHLCTTCT